MTDATSSAAPSTTFAYVSYIRTTPERLWAALTEPGFIKQYWFNCNVETSWKPGSPWLLKYEDGKLADSGEIVEFEPQKRIVIKWQNEWKPEFKAEGFSRCVMEIEALEGAVKLSVTHSMERAQAQFIGAVSGGWPRILSNLKSLLETGEVVFASK